MYAGSYVRTYVRTHVCMYVCLYIHIYIIYQKGEVCWASLIGGFWRTCRDLEDATRYIELDVGFSRILCRVSSKSVPFGAMTGSKRRPCSLKQLYHTYYIYISHYISYDRQYTVCDIQLSPCHLAQGIPITQQSSPLLLFLGRLLLLDQWPCSCQATPMSRVTHTTLARGWLNAFRCKGGPV